MLAPAVHEKLAAILPRESVLTAPEDTKPYECDGLTLFRETPAAVVLPETEAQIVAILKACHAAGVPVVARGAGTGLSGGAMPHRDGVVLSTAKLKKIVSIDPLTRTAVVQPGVRNLAISEAAARYGLYYAPTRRRRSRARSAATSPRTPAACTASSTDSRCTTCGACAR